MAAASLNYCQVRGCRYSQTHTTVAHRCGTCRQYGHRQMECGNPHLKNALRQYIEDQMPAPLQCTHETCSYPWSHSTESHHCYICGERSSHSASECQMRRSLSHELSGGGSSTEVTRQGCITKPCPMCRECSAINLNFKVFTDAPCAICLTGGPKVIFSGCKHANICAGCAMKL